MKKDRRPQESPSPIETLRLERTQLSQAEFAVLCGIPLRTYQLLRLRSLCYSCTDII
ncbi:MAG: hypothetical protein VKK42_30320 [Lyngbya sp.]|nr:hypothetical protein [Lyngbya sp.]